MRFESDVISDGTQTDNHRMKKFVKFESDVISDGTQTWCFARRYIPTFESDVISDGTQTTQDNNNAKRCLRVM